MKSINHHTLTSFDIISIIIPCYNEEKHIIKCINSILNQKNIKIKYEIIIIDDGSKDNTINKINDFILKHPDKKIKLIKLNHAGPAKARNTGIKNSKGKIVLFIDADCIASPLWINTLIKRIEKGDVVGVGGTYRTLTPSKKISDFIGLDIEFRHNSIGNYTDFVGSYNVCFLKSVLIEVNGFDESFKAANAEDNDLCYRISKLNYKIAFEPNAWVSHHHPTSITQFIKQQFTRGMWRIFLYKKNPQKIKGDNYAGFSTLSQPFLPLTSLFIIIIGILNKLPFNILILLSLNFLFFGSFLINYGFIKWIYTKRGFTFSFFSIYLIIIRTTCWFFGALTGILRLVTSKF